MSLPSAPCRRCGRDDPQYVWQTFANGAKHVRVECGACGSFQRYAKQTVEATGRADASPDGRMGLLDFLIVLDDLGIGLQKQSGCMAYYPRWAMTPKWRRRLNSMMASCEA